VYYAGEGYENKLARRMADIIADNDVSSEKQRGGHSLNEIYHL